MNFIALNVIFNNYEKFANNTLCFKPVKVKADDINQSMMEDGLEEEHTSEKDK